MKALHALVGALVVAAALASACGGEDGTSAADEASASAASASAASASAEASRSAASEQAEQERIAEQQAEYDACKRFVGDFLDSLQEVNSRLSVGLNYEEYGNRLGDVRVVYDELVAGISQDTRDCTAKVAIPLEKAFQKYLGVLKVWGECIDDYYCDFSEGATNKAVQASWADATRLIQKSERALQNMAPRG